MAEELPRASSSSLDAFGRPPPPKGVQLGIETLGSEGARKDGNVGSELITACQAVFCNEVDRELAGWFAEGTLPSQRAERPNSPHDERVGRWSKVYFDSVYLFQWCLVLQCRWELENMKPS